MWITLQTVSTWSLLFLITFLTIYVQVLFRRDTDKENVVSSSHEDAPITSVSTPLSAQVEATPSMFGVERRATSCVAPIYFKPTGGRAGWLFDSVAYPRPTEVCFLLFSYSHCF